nr:hypothetical protein KitaXyl93_50840 [Kitasatospora sp. Xyl93]
MLDLPDRSRGQARRVGKLLLTHPGATPVLPYVVREFHRHLLTTSSATVRLVGELTELSRQIPTQDGDPPPRVASGTRLLERRGAGAFGRLRA